MCWKLGFYTDYTVAIASVHTTCKCPAPIIFVVASSAPPTHSLTHTHHISPTYSGLEQWLWTAKPKRKPVDNEHILPWFTECAAGGSCMASEVRPFSAENIFASFAAISTSGCVWPGSMETQYQLTTTCIGGRKWRVFFHHKRLYKYVLLRTLAIRTKSLYRFMHAWIFTPS